MICAIGSGSEIKKIAVQTCFPNAQIYCLEDFQSVVPPQPIGKVNKCFVFFQTILFGFFLSGTNNRRGKSTC